MALLTDVPSPLTATRDDPRGRVQLYGFYWGPPTLLALTVGVVAYFL